VVYPYCILFLLCLSLGLATKNIYTTKKPEIKSLERHKTMNNDNQKQTNAWLTYINNVTATKTVGQLTTSDKLGEPVTLEWHKTNMLTPSFASLMQKVSDMGVAAFMNVEMQFLKTFPEVVGVEPYFKPFEPLFKDGLEAVDWQKVEQTMQAMIKGHFTIDITKFSDEMIKAFSPAIFLCVTARNPETGSLLGYVTFFIQPNFAYGTVKVTGIAVDPSVQGRGLAKLLLSSLFAVLPETERIFLCTRVTNTTALKAYAACGFTKDENPTQEPHHVFDLNHWTFMEYKAEQSSILQKVTKTLAN